MPNYKYAFILFLFFLKSAVSQTNDITAPITAKHPNQLIIHGDTVIDNYFWLRDKNSTEVINHLYAENAYADNEMKRSNFLQKVLYEEFKSRRKESFSSRPTKNKGYYYYNRYEKGKDYVIICRKKDTIEEFASETVILDVNKIAEEQPQVNLTGIQISPNQQLLYYGIDTKGNRVSTYFLKHINKDSVFVSEKLENVMSLMWAQDNKTVFYTKPEDKTLREYRVYRHVIGTPISQDEMILEELSKTYQLSFTKSISKKYIFITSSKTKSTEVWYLNADGSSIKPTLFLKRDSTIIYNLEHIAGDDFNVITNLNAINYRLAKTKISQPLSKYWIDILPHNPNVLLEDVSYTKDFMIIQEKENAQERIKIVNLKNKETIVLNPNLNKNEELDISKELIEKSGYSKEYKMMEKKLNSQTATESKDLKAKNSDTLNTNLDIYEISTGFEDYDYEKTTSINYSFSNLANPSQTFSYDLYTRKKELVDADTILGNFNKKNYETKRIYANSRDGLKVPITLVYKKGLQLNGKNPCLLNSYGSYGSPNSSGFNLSAISYIDRGFVYAIAHIRGSNDLGNQWYENGKLLTKKNTFYDFIDCAEYLINEKYTHKNKLAINGGSAGGLLMGAVTNMRPDLFKCVVANVPFVDVINTMLDETLPLTTFEFEEWGNPKQKEYYNYMKSYSPYENVIKTNYPDILATAGYNDSQVGYWEPAKWVSKIRELKTDSNLLLFKTNMDGGHQGASGRYGAYKEQAFDMAFIMQSLGVKENYITIKGKIIDEKKTELPFVNVFLEGTTNGTTANADGDFEITVKQNDNVTLVFQTLGYVKHKEKLDINTQTSDLKIVMKSENYLIQEVVVKSNAKDPAYAIMREAIKQRSRNNNKVNSFSADVYMKSTVRLLEMPKNLPFFINKKDLPDSNNLGIIYMSESVAKYSMQKPDKKKEEMIASKVAGQKVAFSWNRVEDVFVNFYEPSIKMFNYSERPFVSPLATGSILNYKYKYLGTFYVDNKPIHKIEIIPRRKGDPLFHGEMYINEGDNYQIYSSDLYITKDSQIDFADTVHIKQEMVKVNDSIWAPVQMQIYSHVKFFGFGANDLSTASISNYQVNRTFPKKYFNNEIFKIEDKANKKDTTFWTTTRTAILSNEESKYYQKGDSSLKRMESKSYKDSVSKADSKLSFGIDGISKRNDVRSTYFSTNSFLNMISYNTVEGRNVNLKVSFSHRNKLTRASKGVSAIAHYGFDNYRWSGGANGFWLFNPKKNQSIAVTVQRSIKQYNEFEPIGNLLNMAYTLFDKSNYMKLYQKDMLRVNYNHELVNGLYSNLDAQFINREALLNKSFYYLYGDENKSFTSNNPVVNDGAYSTTEAFKPEQVVQVKLGFKLIPFAKYETYPTFKRILQTKWPEFSFTYKKGMSLNNASFNYDYLEIGVGKDIELRSLGQFKFDITGGLFLNNENMNFVDYKHFNGNQTFFLLNKPNSEMSFLSTRDQISEFHNLNYYSLSTNTKFFEYHASHNFRGFFIGKIPILRKTKFYEIAGINGVITETGTYNEVYIGIDKIIKVFRFDIGTAINENKKIDLFYRFGLRLSLF